MLRSLPILAAAFAVPIIVLMAMAGVHQYNRSAGTVLILPIEGYDPRDLLSGYYPSYRVDYGVDDVCPEYDVRKGYICMDTRTFAYAKPAACERLIRGKCSRHSQFQAGIERYYLPEQNARELDRMLREPEVYDFSIEVSVTRGGKASVRELLLDGFPWDEE